MLVENIKAIQYKINTRKANMLHKIETMAEFKKYIVTIDVMGLLEKFIMMVKAKSFRVKKIHVKENFEKPKDIKQWLKEGLNAKRIIQYKQSDYNFTYIVWYV